MRELVSISILVASLSFTCQAAAQDSDKTTANLILENVQALCRTPGEQGKALDIELSGSGGAIAGLRNLPRAAGSVSAEFSRSEWEGVQRVLKEHQFADNKDYRECVKLLAPVFLDKFGPYRSNPTMNANSDDDRVIYIDWSTTALESDLCKRVGQTFQVSCPPNGAVSRCQGGNDVYSCNSRICTAAVHAGVISTLSGGVFEVAMIGVIETSQASVVSNGVRCGSLPKNWTAFEIRSR